LVLLYSDNMSYDEVNKLKEQVNDILRAYFQNLKKESCNSVKKGVTTAKEKGLDTDKSVFCDMVLEDYADQGLKAISKNDFDKASRIMDRTYKFLGTMAFDYFNKIGSEVKKIEEKDTGKDLIYI
jgi:hypothetical protein